MARTIFCRIWGKQRPPLPGKVLAAQRKAKQQRNLKALADCTSPKRRSAYAIFMQDMYPVVSEQVAPGKRPQRKVVSTIAQLWRDMSPEERAKYEARSKADMNAWHRHRDFVLNSASSSSETQQGSTHFGCFELDASPCPDLGSGSYGVIYAVRHMKEGFSAMVKVFSALLKGQISEHGFCKIVQECTDQQHFPWVVLEHMPCNLRFHIEQQGALTGWPLAALSVQVARALQVLHMAKWLHCDLKPANTLWDPRRNMAKLINFTVSQATRPEVTVQDRPSASAQCSGSPLSSGSQHNVYTGPYRAPELWSSSARTMRASFATEAWALGCLILEACSAEVVFTSYQAIATFVQARHPPHVFQSKCSRVKLILSKAPTALQTLAWQLLNPCPKARLSVPEFCEIHVCQIAKPG